MEKSVSQDIIVYHTSPEHVPFFKSFFDILFKNTNVVFTFCDVSQIDSCDTLSNLETIQSCIEEYQTEKSFFLDSLQQLKTELEDPLIIASIELFLQVNSGKKAVSDAVSCYFRAYGELLSLKVPELSPNEQRIMRDFSYNYNKNLRKHYKYFQHASACVALKVIDDDEEWNEISTKLRTYIDFYNEKIKTHNFLKNLWSRTKDIAEIPPLDRKSITDPCKFRFSKKKTKIMFFITIPIENGKEYDYSRDAIKIKYINIAARTHNIPFFIVVPRNTKHADPLDYTSVASLIGVNTDIFMEFEVAIDPITKNCTRAEHIVNKAQQSQGRVQIKTDDHASMQRLPDDPRLFVLLQSHESLTKPIIEQVFHPFQVILNFFDRNDPLQSFQDKTFDMFVFCHPLIETTTMFSQFEKDLRHLVATAQKTHKPLIVIVPVQSAEPRQKLVRRFQKNLDSLNLKYDNIKLLIYYTPKDPSDQHEDVNTQYFLNTLGLKVKTSQQHRATYTKTSEQQSIQQPVKTQSIQQHVKKKSRQQASQGSDVGHIAKQGSKTTNVFATHHNKLMIRLGTGSVIFGTCVFIVFLILKTRPR